MPGVSLIGHHHSCPKHKGGPVVSGQTGCSVNGIPVAVVGDICMCNKNRPDMIVSGHSGLTVNGKPVAIIGSSTAHGGVLVEGVDGLTVD